MEKTHIKVGLLILIIISLTYQSVAQLSHRDTTLLWNHFDYVLDENNGMASYSTTNIVGEYYTGVVIENEFVRLVILPEFGARIISFYYKPTGHEQFYTNPVGTPYGMGDGNFYYDWLMVMGGIFPTFPEPEHGKTWFLPWQWEFTEISSDRITIKMQLKDTISYPGHPGKFNNGVTEIQCITSVSLQKGNTCFEFNHIIQNTKSETQPFEYWTCATLAPGSETGNTFTPANSEIIAPIEYVYLKDNWWSWMGNAENPAYGQGNHVFKYENLAFYDNWEDMGIAYAHPAIEENYYGVINHENSEGVFRVADNVNITSGMKFWTWGAEQGLNANPENFYHTARPYIELWSGLSTQFFEDAYLLPNEIISWTETYLPTVNMDSITYVNENGAIFLGHENDDSENFLVKLFNTIPNTEFDLEVSLNGLSVANLFDGSYISDSKISSQFRFYLNDFIIEDGDYILNAKVYDQNEELVIESSIPVTIPYSYDDIINTSISKPKVYRISEFACKFEFDKSAIRNLAVFSINGQLLQQHSITDNSAVIQVNKAGLYIFRIEEGNRSYSVKMIF